jgi:hypothetical protein
MVRRRRLDGGMIVGGNGPVHAIAVGKAVPGLSPFDERRLRAAAAIGMAAATGQQAKSLDRQPVGTVVRIAVHRRHQHHLDRSQAHFLARDIGQHQEAQDVVARRPQGEVEESKKSVIHGARVVAAARFRSRSLMLANQG